jgi:hypothetical protein
MRRLKNSSCRNIDRGIDARTRGVEGRSAYNENSIIDPDYRQIDYGIDVRTREVEGRSAYSENSIIDPDCRQIEGSPNT